MVFHKSLNDNKSPQVSRTLLSILDDLNIYNWDGLHSSVNFQDLLSLHKTFGDCTERANYNWYRCYFYVAQFFQFASNV